MTKEIFYSTDSFEHECNILGLDPERMRLEQLELEEEMSNFIPEEKLCSCGEFEIYSETLTNGMCLNCYHNVQEEIREMNLECELDRAEREGNY